MQEKKGIKGILLLAGEGKRFGHAMPKQFLFLSGKKIYLHTLTTFIKTEAFEEIILVCHRDWIDTVKEETAEEFPLSPVRVVEGGNTRQLSSFLGLLACGDKTEIVVIHDAVRPFVSSKIIFDNIEAAKKYQAVDTCIPSADTIIHSKDTGNIDSIPPRHEYFRGQTPQSFSYHLILEAHRLAQTKHFFNASDDCRLVLESGHPVHMVEGDESNIKITSELDLFLAEQLFRLQVSSLPSQASQQSLKGKCFAITGGTGGIGRAIARLLEQEGASVFLISLSSPYFSADLTSYEQAHAIFEHIYQKYGALDGLINSIGILCVKQLSALTKSEIEQLIDVNFKSIVYSSKCAQLKKGGHVINISSSACFRGRKDFAVYSAAKAAVVNFSQGFALEHPDLNVNVIVPQRTDTSLRRQHFPEEDPSTLLSPESVAEAVVSLLKQSKLTGCLIEVKRSF